MSHIDQNNGGYYAIKGFEYQIDKAILDILSCKNKNDKIGIEQIQDINSDNYVMQVKYRETQKYSPTKIKAPIIQLIEEFSKNLEGNSSKIYYLYCYFLNKNEGVENVDLAYLKRILGRKDKDFNENLKLNFLNNFQLVFSPTFQGQFENVISKIKETFCSGKAFEEAVFYYANISNYLRKIVITNNDPLKRVCSKKEIENLINDGKKLVFDSAFRDYKGKNNYFKFIKSQYFTFREIDNYERFIVIELNGNESITAIKSAILSIKKKFYVKNKRSLKSGAPYIYFVNISENGLKALKTNLLTEGYVLKDGHDFMDADFSLKTISEPSNMENNVCLKFLNNKQNFLSVVGKNLGKTKEVYQFYFNDPFELSQDIRNVKIQIEELSDISYIL